MSNNTLTRGEKVGRKGAYANILTGTLAAYVNQSLERTPEDQNSDLLPL